MGFASGVNVGLKAGQQWRQRRDASQIEDEINEQVAAREAEIAAYKGSQAAANNTALQPKVGLQPGGQSPVQQNPVNAALSGPVSAPQQSAVEVARPTGPAPTAYTDDELAGMRADAYRARGYDDIAARQRDLQMAIRADRRAESGQQFEQGLRTRVQEDREENTRIRRELSEARGRLIDTQASIAGIELKDREGYAQFQEDFADFDGTPEEFLRTPAYQGANMQHRQLLVSEMTGVTAAEQELGTQRALNGLRGTLEQQIKFASDDQFITPDSRFAMSVGKDKAGNEVVAISEFYGAGDQTDGGEIYSGTREGATEFLRNFVKDPAMGAAYYRAERAQLNSQIQEIRQAVFDQRMDMAEARTKMIDVMLGMPEYSGVPGEDGIVPTGQIISAANAALNGGLPDK